MDRKNARGGMTRLFINLGKNQNVKPGDILGAIAGESGIPGRLVGSIDMYDKYTSWKFRRSRPISLWTL